MPYVFVEELGEGQEEAAVITREEHEQTVLDLEEARTQRDAAIERAETAEKGWREAKEKYANTFLSTPSGMSFRTDPPKATPMSVKELFSRKDA